MSEVERRRGGDIFLGESGQLSIHEEMPYVVVGSCLSFPPTPTWPADVACMLIITVVCSVGQCRRQDHTTLPSPLHRTQFKSHFTHFLISVSFVWPKIKVQSFWVYWRNNFIISENIFVNFDVLLTVHLSITLVNCQLDEQFFYFIIRLLQSSTCFEQRRAHHQVKLY